MLINKLLGLAIVLASSSVYATSGTVAGDTCGVPDRTATLSASDYCSYGEANPDADDILGYYAGDAWLNEGELTGDGTDDYLSATSSIGWGSIPNNGTWGIDSSFWTMYDQAVITMHVGHAGDAAPDHWAWLVTAGELTGTWSLDFAGPCDGEGAVDCRGGGLSNIKLWGRGEGTTIPEPSILWLMGAGLLGMGVLRRRRKA